jgi:hypothetical protein
MQMNAIDRPGTFRGKPLEWGVSETKNGFPQFVVRFQATEFYDEEAGAYMPWAEYDQEATAFLVLFTKKDEQWVELLNAAQVKKVFGWDGLTFESLANGKYEGLTVLFRVEPNTYNGQTTLKVTWIDTADSNPTKTLTKYDSSKLAAMTQAMSGALKPSTQAPAPAKAPAKAPARGPGRPPKSTLPASQAAPAGAKPGAPSTATPPRVSPAPAPAAPSGNPPPVNPVIWTQETAWNAVNEMKSKDVTDEKLAEVWVAEGGKIGKTEDKFTSADWEAVKVAVQSQTAIF